MTARVPAPLIRADMGLTGVRIMGTDIRGVTHTMAVIIRIIGRTGGAPTGTDPRGVTGMDTMGAIIGITVITMVLTTVTAVRVSGKSRFSLSPLYRALVPCRSLRSPGHALLRPLSRPIKKGRESLFCPPYLTSAQESENDGVLYGLGMFRLVGIRGKALSGECQRQAR